VGFRPIIPLGFAVAMALLLPVGWVVAGLLERLDAHVPREMVPWVGLVGSVVLLALSALPPAAWVGLFLFAAVLGRPTRPAPHWPVAMLAVVLGYTALWSVNYVALWFVRARLADTVLRASDLALYGFLWQRPIDYRGWFPLVTSPLLLSIFQSAYALFFLEISVLTCLLDRDRLAVYLTQLFVCYGIALAVFVVWPIAGPSLAYPESVRPVFAGTAVERIMLGARAEFVAVLAGTQPPTTTLGYFVGLPSLHAAGAVLFQQTLRPFRQAFWTLLPVNLVMFASAVVLGFHYVADVVAGVLLAVLVILATSRRRQAGDPR
jgi:membrane-associated phospholipid phosphatase